ncbi:MAG: Rab family GTPase [Candidatus Odinarchaeia archaeon]
MPGSFSIKIIVVGDAAVGKTSLVLNYVQKKFKSDYLPTIGVDIYSKEVSINEKNVKFVVWDIAGQKGWEVMHRSYYRGAQGALAVFDLTRKKTLKNLESWLNKIDEYLGKKIPVIILGNKKDLKVSIEVDQKDIEKFREKYNYPYIATSAKTGENVQLAFEDLAKKILKIK